jgi:hypothetical protein
VSRSSFLSVRTSATGIYTQGLTEDRLDMLEVVELLISSAASEIAAVAPAVCEYVDLFRVLVRSAKARLCPVASNVFSLK